MSEQNREERPASPDTQAQLEQMYEMLVNLQKINRELSAAHDRATQTACLALIEVARLRKRLGQHRDAPSKGTHLPLTDVSLFD